MAEYVDNLMTAMAATPEFKPANLNTFGDWSLEAGDMITTIVDGISHIMPIFDADMSWSGAAETRLTASGNTAREVQDKQERESYSALSGVGSAVEDTQQKLYKLYHGLQDTIDFDENDDGTLKTALLETAIREAIEEEVTLPDGTKKYVLTESVLDLVAIKNEDGTYTSLASLKATADGAQAGLSSKVDSSTFQTEIGKKLDVTAASTIYAKQDDMEAYVGAYVLDSGTTLAAIGADLVTISGKKTEIGQLNISGTNVEISDHGLSIPSGTITIGGSSAEAPSTLGYTTATDMYGTTIRAQNLQVATNSAGSMATFTPETITFLNGTFSVLTI